MELLATARLLDAGIVRTLADASWLPDRGTPVGFLCTSPARMVPDASELHFSVEINNALRRETPLDGTLSMIFSASQAPAEQQAQYERVRGELQHRVAQAGKIEQLQQLQVLVRCVVWAMDRSARRPNRGTDEIFNDNLVTATQAKLLFERAAELMEQQSEAASGCVTFTLTSVRLELKECFPITPEVVRAAKALAQFDMVSAPTVAVDPRLIFCSSDELEVFLQVLSRHSSEFRVDIGYAPNYHRFTAIDDDGGDKRELIVMVMTALAACTNLQWAGVGGLLLFLSQPHNRRHFWEALLEILLAPLPESTPRKEFCLDMDTKLSDDDAAVISLLGDLTARPRRPIDRFQFSLTPESPNESIVQVVSLVRDMERLNFAFNVATSPEVLLRDILQCSRKLQSVCLSHAEMSSFAVLIEPTGSGKCLENIELIIPREVTQPGITAFLTELLNPSTPLAKSLRCLKIASFNSRIYNSECDTANAELLERVLCVNRQLHVVSVPVNATVPEVIKQALRSHTGDAVWWNPRVPEFSIKERCALLSVVNASPNTRAVSQVDTLVLQRIFAFAQAFTTRRVDV